MTAYYPRRGPRRAGSWAWAARPGQRSRCPVGVGGDRGAPVADARDAAGPGHRRAVGDAAGTGPAVVPPTLRADRPASRTVAGFDLTFSAPKSVSVAWALADPATRERIRAAHAKALQFVIAHAEARVFATRTGHAGAISQDVRGIVAAAFEHWDSRAGDPQLHTHVVVLNRVQAVVDGRWRTLDSRVLFKATVGLSELYNAALTDYLTADLGYGWVPTGAAPVGGAEVGDRRGPGAAAAGVLSTLRGDRDRQGRPGQGVRRRAWAAADLP